MRLDPRPVGSASHLRSHKALAATAVATASLFASAIGAEANPSLRDKRAQAEAIVAEVERIGDEVGAAAERFNGANYELGRLTVRLDETRADLVQARGMRDTAQGWIAKRLRALYINGDSAGTLEVVLGAKSLDEVLARIDVAQRVSAQDARIAREAEELRQRVAQRKRELTAARARQLVVVRQRAAEKRTIEAKLAEQERLLASVRDEIAQLEEAERQRQAELRRQAQLALEEQRRAAAAQIAAQQEAAAQQHAAAPAASDPAPPLEEAAPDEGTPTTSDFTAPPADASRGAQVVAIAMQYLGIPYQWGGASPSGGFDCSGLTMYVFAQIGISLPHYAAAQYGLGSPVSKEDLQPGDLVFFRSLGHMGLYIGGGNMIHAPRTGDVVKISSIHDPYYTANWVGARRVL